MFNDWLSWSNFFYLMGLVLAGGITLVASKYKNIIKEIGDVAEKLESGYKDKKLTKAEKDAIMKEVLDVMKAVINLRWRIF